jgi:DNA polymerase III subunit epsilon
MEFGIIVDVETTGLDSSVDKIIEIGICEFVWSKGSEPTLTRMYGGLEDPKKPLNPEIVKLTGLTNEVLTEQTIDWQAVASMWRKSSIVIAHNAEFDRGFLSRVPILSGEVKHWGCSVRHIDWRALGFESRKLNYLAADHYLTVLRRFVWLNPICLN